MYYYHPKYKQIKLGPFTTSKIEIADLIKAWLGISIAFGVILYAELNNIPVSILVAAISVGSGFLLHEIAHKLVAQHYGCLAEFRANMSMIFLAIIMSFLGFIFAAPGAVMIVGPVGVKRNGIISIAGPLTNYALAILFLVVGIIVPIENLSMVFHYGFIINIWIGLFNMIPFLNFDGQKIWAWNKIIYISMLVFGGLVMVLSSYKF